MFLFQKEIFLLNSAIDPTIKTVQLTYMKYLCYNEFDWLKHKLVKPV